MEKVIYWEGNMNGKNGSWRMKLYRGGTLLKNIVVSLVVDGVRDVINTASGEIILKQEASINEQPKVRLIDVVYSQE